MAFIKPLFRTLFFSSLLFFIAVFLGMKYHWIRSNTSPSAAQETALPPSNVVETTLNDSLDNNKLNKPNADSFTPQIMDVETPSSLLLQMSKVQVKKACQTLSEKMSMDKGMSNLFVLNCVVSNYKEPYQELSQIEKDKSRTYLLRCQKEAAQQTMPLQPLERELLTGICVSRYN